MLREELVDFAFGDMERPIMPLSLVAAAARERLSIYLAVTVCEYM